VARSSNGGTAIASSEHSSGNYPRASAIDGDRKGNNWGNNGGWNDGTRGLYDDTLEVDFSGSKTINVIDVYTLQNGWNSGAGDPNLTTSASGEGILDFDVEYWNGSAFVAPPGCPGGCSVIGNDKALRRFTFPAVTTTKIQVVVHNSRSNYSRIVELEAYASCP
jgi:hypothetical protein